MSRQCEYTENGGRTKLSASSTAACAVTVAVRGTHRDSDSMTNELPIFGNRLDA